MTPRFELLGRLSCGARSCSHALFFKAFVLLRGMRWRRQIIGVGEKIGGNFAAAKEPLQLAAWGKIFLCVGACGFRREGVKLSEVGEGARIPARQTESAAISPSAFFARRRKWRRSRFACLLSLPLRQRGDNFSRSRGSCRHDSPPRPFAQGLCANFSTACSKVIFYYKWGNRDSEFPCCFGFSSRDRA